VRGYPRLARPSQRADLGWILPGLIAWITAISTKSGQAIAANYCGSIWGLGEVSEQRVSASTALAGGEEVRRRKLR
jgi:hypothetical protein